MKQLRCIVTVINQVKTHVEDERIIKKLNEVIDKACWKAPELHDELWNELGHWLNAYYPIPLKNDKQVKIVSIFTTMSEEDVRKYYC